MRVIIAGSRTIQDYSVVSEILQDHPDITEIVCGMASGVDLLGALYGKANNIPVKEFPADWNQFGKYAGHKRNCDMGQYADELIAIWDGRSKGTEHMIRYMKSLDKETTVYKIGV